MRRAARVDGNQREIVRRLRLIGARVTSTAGVGNGFPDIVVGYRRRNYLFEIKDPAQPPNKRKLTPMEREWHRDWRGEAHVIESFEDALEVMTGRRP